MELKRGTKVNFKGNEYFKPIQGTYIWAKLEHLSLSLYVVQHPDGNPKQNFMAKPPLEDGFEAVHSKELDENYFYVYAEQHEIELVEQKIIYVDIDNTLCISDKYDADGELDYTKSIPIQKNIEKVNNLFQQHKIVLFTARGKRTGKIDWRDFTVSQIKTWGINFHEINFGKPHFDILIDDKAVNNFSEFEKIKI